MMLLMVVLNTVIVFVFSNSAWKRGSRNTKQAGYHFAHILSALTSQLSLGRVLSLKAIEEIPNYPFWGNLLKTLLTQHQMKGTLIVNEIRALRGAYLKYWQFEKKLNGLKLSALFQMLFCSGCSLLLIIWIGLTLKRDTLNADVDMMTLLFVLQGLLVFLFYWGIQFLQQKMMNPLKHYFQFLLHLKSHLGLLNGFELNSLMAPTNHNFFFLHPLKEDIFHLNHQLREILKGLQMEGVPIGAELNLLMEDILEMQTRCFAYFEQWVKVLLVIFIPVVFLSIHFVMMDKILKI